MQTILQHNPFAGTVPNIHANSRRALWTGRLLSGLAVAFLMFDSVGKLLVLAPVIDFPAYVAALLWGGLVLRDARLRRFLLWRDWRQS
jgi:hypothetical protein